MYLEATTIGLPISGRTGRRRVKMTNELLHNSDVSQVLRAVRRTYTAVHAQPQATRGQQCARATTAAVVVSTAVVKAVATILSPKSAIQPASITGVRQVGARPIRRIRSVIRARCSKPHGQMMPEPAAWRVQVLPEPSTGAEPNARGRSSLSTHRKRLRDEGSAMAEGLSSGSGFRRDGRAGVEVW